MTVADSQPRHERPATLTNPRSDRVKEVAQLAGRRARRRHNRILVEGPQAVREAVKFCGNDLIDVYISDSAWERHSDLVDAASRATRWVHRVSDEVATAMSPDAQGIIAVTRAFTTDGLPRVDWSFVCVLAQTQDPGNAGTMIRAADAAGADAVIVCSGSVDPTSPKVVRSSAGSVFHLPTITGVGFDEVVEWARARRMNIVAADGHGAIDLFACEDGTEPLDLASPIAWVFGNEAHGFSDLATTGIDYMVSIPMGGHAESLNVSSAATLCLFATARARRHLAH